MYKHIPEWCSLSLVFFLIYSSLVSLQYLLHQIIDSGHLYVWEPLRQAKNYSTNESTGPKGDQSTCLRPTAQRTPRYPSKKGKMSSSRKVLQNLYNNQTVYHLDSRRKCQATMCQFIVDVVIISCIQEINTKNRVFLMFFL
jgi:hypothetical protein